MYPTQSVYNETEDQRRMVVKTGYQAILRQDGKWWVGWVPALPGVMSQGETREELLSNLRSCIREWLEIQEEDT